MLTREEREKLRKLVGEATAGPWKLEEDWTAELYGADGSLIGKVVYPGKIGDSRFIAATDPPTVLALLDQIEELEARVRELEGKE